MPKIDGGYYIKARKIQDSAIAKSAPHVREIWDWLLKAANHKDNKCYGVTIKRGQLFTDYSEIIEELSWREGFVKKSYKKHHVDYAMRWLRQELMITTQKTTRGLLITVCNYNTYQNPANYENDFDYDTITTRLRQGTDTIHKNGNNDKNINNKINTQGDFSSPRTPESVPGFNYLPDGRSYIEPTVFYKASDFNGLPEQNLYSVIDFFKATKNIEIEPERVKMVWTVFKTQELTEQKPYRNKDDVYRHFMNWCKRQSFAKEKKASRTYEKEKSDVKVVGVEFINNFNQCRMSDGSIQDLDVNQRDLAKYNHINPNSISKR